jgi:hypothetical protein
LAEGRQKRGGERRMAADLSHSLQERGAFVESNREGDLGEVFADGGLEDGPERDGRTFVAAEKREKKPDRIVLRQTRLALPQRRERTKIW